MKITEKLMVKKRLVSFEIFPPKTEASYKTIEMTMREIAAFNPDFVSVTYGAGGNGSSNTEKIASFLKNNLDTTALAHLTCIGSGKSQIKDILQSLKNNNIDNVLALRGDIPDNYDVHKSNSYNHANELVEFIKNMGGFDIGGACYPESHPESKNLDEDIEYLRNKVDCGIDFLITQLFYDNNCFYKFIDKIRNKAIDVPVFAGIMPLTSVKQIDRITGLSNASMPNELVAMINKYKDNPDDFKKAGIDFAIKQINQLIENDVNGIHIYTMNKPDVARTILKGIPIAY